MRGHQPRLQPASQLLAVSAGWCPGRRLRASHGALAAAPVAAWAAPGRRPRACTRRAPGRRRGGLGACVPGAFGARPLRAGRVQPRPGCGDSGGAGDRARASPSGEDAGPGGRRAWTRGWGLWHTLGVRAGITERTASGSWERAGARGARGPKEGGGWRCPPYSPLHSGRPGFAVLPGGHPGGAVLRRPHVVPDPCVQDNLGE